MAFRYSLKNDKNIKTHIYFNENQNKNLDDIKILLEDNENINIFPNDENVDPYNSYKNVTDYVYRIVTKS